MMAPPSTVADSLRAIESGCRTMMTPATSTGPRVPDKIACSHSAAWLHAMEQATFDPRNWLAEHGDRLYRYALTRIGDHGKAEDLVQDTLIAAFESRHRFEGKSKESTWLIGILKHKVMDHLRVRGREVPTDFDASPEALDDDDAFDHRGHWQSAVGAWSNPDRALEQEAFLTTLERCIEALPERAGEAFRLRELHGLDTEEICAALDIDTPNNLFVILSRARMRLRDCLSAHWFEENRGADA